MSNRFFFWQSSK